MIKPCPFCQNPNAVETDTGEACKKSLEQKIRDKAEKVVMDYLTDGNPEGDFKKSTIGADDFIYWYIQGYMDCLNQLNRHHPYLCKLQLISDDLPIR